MKSKKLLAETDATYTSPLIPIKATENGIGAILTYQECIVPNMKIILIRRR